MRFQNSFFVKRDEHDEVEDEAEEDHALEELPYEGWGGHVVGGLGWVGSRTVAGLAGCDR